MRLPFRGSRRSSSLTRLHQLRRSQREVPSLWFAFEVARLTPRHGGAPRGAGQRGDTSLMSHALKSVKGRWPNRDPGAFAPVMVGGPPHTPQVPEATRQDARRLVAFGHREGNERQHEATSSSPPTLRQRRSALPMLPKGPPRHLTRWTRSRVCAGLRSWDGSRSDR